MAQRRVALITGDPLTGELAGPGIRARELAAVLAAEHEVWLASTEQAALELPGVRVGSAATRREIQAIAEWCDVLIFQGFLLKQHPWLERSECILVADLYDPFQLEHLEELARGSDGMAARHHAFLPTVEELNRQLLRADLVLCAGPKQRDFWIGQLAALGRVNPFTYHDDPSLGELVVVVPSGVPERAPVHSKPVLRGVIDGIREGDLIVLWGGGLHPWLDPFTVAKAAHSLSERLPVRMVFLAGRHPSKQVGVSPHAADLRKLCSDLDASGSLFFFVDEWVPYEDRQNYLIEADAGVSAHSRHLESEYAFRTRLLDYIWAGLPVATTQGDEAGALVEREGLGVTVPPGEVAPFARALETILDAGKSEAYRRRLEAAAADLRWEKVARPLMDFCANPRRAPDSGRVPRWRFDTRSSAAARVWRDQGWKSVVKKSLRRAQRALRRY